MIGKIHMHTPPHINTNIAERNMYQSKKSSLKLITKPTRAMLSNKEAVFLLELGSSARSSKTKTSNSLVYEALI